MKKLTLSILACVVLISACTGLPVENPGDQATFVLKYRCDGGEKITVTYPSTDSATVVYQGKTYNMQIAVSGSGSRYVNGEFEWRTKGSGPGSNATLFRIVAGDTTSDIIERCTER